MDFKHIDPEFVQEQIPGMLVLYNFVLIFSPLGKTAERAIYFFKFY